MSWREIPAGKAIDLDTLPVGAKVRARTTSKAVPVIELEKLPGRVHELATAPVAVVDAKGSVVERRRYIPRLACLTGGLTDHFFTANGQDAPLPRILGENLSFQIPTNASGERASLVIQKVEIQL